MKQFEPYPDELEKIGHVVTKLQRQFEFTSGNETDRKVFEMAAHNEFGQIGIRIAVNWEEIYSAMTNTPTGVHIPHLELVGRIREESETDHDRIRHGVVTGKADGVKGYIRADGTWSDEPIKKNIL